MRFVSPEVSQSREVMFDGVAVADPLRREPSAMRIASMLVTLGST
jgi:hypothetical protein